LALTGSFYFKLYAVAGITVMCQFFSIQTGVLQTFFARACLEPHILVSASPVARHESPGSGFHLIL
jgi:hypothetical protein